MKEGSGHMFGLLCVTLVGFGIGYFVRDDSVQVAQLQKELDKRTSTENGDETQIVRRRSPNPFTRRTAALIATNGNMREDISDERSSLLRRAEVTSEDIEATRALDEQQRQGEFILRNESPFLRKVREYDFNRIATQAASNNAPLYNHLFSELGIVPEISKQLQNHLTKIHKASLEAELAMSQVVNARREYDKRVRSLLTDEDYERYRLYEATIPARHEFDGLQKFVQEKHNAAIDPQFGEIVISLIRESGATENGWWHGPYDPLPDIKVGWEQMRLWSEHQVDKAVLSTSDLMEQISVSGLPDEYEEYL